MRFSIRSLFVLIAVCSLALSFGLWVTQEYRRQLQVRRELESVGAGWVGFVSADDAVLTNVVFGREVTEDLENTSRFHTIELKGFEVTNDCLDRLANLDHIEQLMFVSCELSSEDASSLTRYKDTSTVIFWNVQVADDIIPTVKRISGLKRVAFKTTSVTQPAIKALREALPDLDVIYVP